MKIFKQKYKTPSKKEFPPIITYHDKRYGGTKVDEQGRFYTVKMKSQRLNGKLGSQLLEYDFITGRFK